MSSVKKSITQACLGLSLFAVCGVEAYWSYPTTLSSRNWEVTNSMDADGNTTAVWTDWYSRTSHVYSANLRKGQGEYWRAPNVVFASKSHLCQFVRLGTDAMWNSVALWEEYDQNGTFQVRGSVRPYGGYWSSPIDMSPLYHNATFPELAMTPSGYFVAVWQKQDSTTSVIQAATLKFGSTWSAPVDISLATEKATAAQVCVDHAGNAVAVWFNGRDVESAVLPYEGKWSAPTTLAFGNGSEPKLAMNESGYAVAIWGTDTLNAATLQVGGTWSAPVKLETTSRFIVDCELAIDANRNAVAVWVQQDLDESLPFPIFTNRYIVSSSLPVGGSWSMPVNLSSTKEMSEAYSPRVAFDGSGNARAVWNTKSAIQTATVAANGAWSESTDIGYGTLGLSSRPSLSVDATGYAVINWSNESGGIDGITWTPDAEQ